MYSRIHHRFKVPALTPDDTAEYLRMRLARAGCHREVFASNAIVVLHEATLGAMRDHGLSQVTFDGEAIWSDSDVQRNHGRDYNRTSD